MVNIEYPELPTNPQFHNLTGLEFGRLIVLSYAGQAKNRTSRWVCKCACGKIKTIQSTGLKNGTTQSCGCRNREITSALLTKLSTKHGLSKTLAYPVWKAMKTRCTNSNYPCYKHYGGRGITICERWLNSFENFLEDMGERPSLEYSIDRIDNNGNYEPENCRWATEEEQRWNKRSTLKIIFNGVEQTTLDLSIQFNIPADVIRSRLKCGWTIELALSTPYNKRSSITILPNEEL